jgi:recombination protein RecA
MAKTAKKVSKVTDKKEEVKTKEPKKPSALDLALKGLDKKLGKGAVGLYGKAIKVDYDVVPTDSLLLDKELGCGGIPLGRIIEVYGPQAAGKTFLCQKIMSQFQKKFPKKRTAFIDAEHALDPDWAKEGPARLDMSKVIFTQPQSAEEALDTALVLIETGELSVLCIDSVPALVPQAELDGDMATNHMGLHARLMNQFMRKVLPLLSKTNTTLLLINQCRMKIGVMFGNPETTPGGMGIPYQASMRFRVSKMKMLGDKTDPTGWRMIVRINKNKCGVPFKAPEFNIDFKDGISLENDLIKLGVKYGFLEKESTWYSVAKDAPIKGYEGSRIGHGMDNAIEFLKENPKLSKALEKEIRAA